MIRNYIFSKKVDIAIKILGLLFVLSVISFWVIKNFYIDDKKKLNVIQIEYCDTDTCNATAKFIISHMNRSVDPCDDFYEYACGRFINKAVISDTDLSTDFINDVYNHLHRQVNDSIVNSVSTPNEPKTFEKLRQYYRTCVEDRNNTNSDKEFIQFLNDLGGWPVLLGNSWNESNFNLAKTISTLVQNAYDNDLIIGLEISLNKKNHTRKHLKINQGKLGLSYRYLKEGLENKYVKLYYKYMVDTAVFFGANRSQAEIELFDTLIFNIKLTNISLSPEVRQELMKNETDNLLTIKEVQSKYPFLDWLDMLNGIFNPEITLNDTEQVIMSDLTYYEQIGDLLKVTPKRIIANYIFWRTTKSVVKLLSKNLRDIGDAYYSSAMGIKATISREEDCLNQILNFFPLAASSLYVRNFVNKSTKADVENMVYYIRHSSKNMLQETNWLDNETKNIALEKLDWLITGVGYPDELLDNNKIDELYEKWEIVDGNYWQSILKASKFYKNIDFLQFRKPFERLAWTGSFGNAADINAYYNFQANSIIIPSAIMKGFFYNKDRPKYVNYGVLGSTIGHEITHAFDDIGRLYDKEGSRVNWWTNQTEKAFNNKLQCFIEQYNNFTLKEVDKKVNGNLTLGENIADNGGVKKSYYAYNSWLSTQDKEEPRLRGLEPFTNRQMFWISYAQTWCEKVRPEVLEKVILLGSHAPGRSRVNNPLSNMGEFANDFMCPPNSKMNPVKKCTIW